ncbi:MAG: DUF4126 domain-containing protein, partial [bacterium]
LESGQPTARKRIFLHGPGDHAARGADHQSGGQGNTRMGVTTSAIELSLYIMMGIGLAAVAGLRAFLPLCVLAWLTQTDLIHLSPAYAWLGSIPALIIFTVAAVVEIAADKIPVVDNILDQVADYIKPVAGTLLVSSVITQWDPLTATVFGICAGGSIAALFHTGKKLTRLGSTAATLGLGNPVISAAEDLAGGLGILTAVMLPALAFTVVVLTGYGIFRGSRKVYSWFQNRLTPSGLATL